MSIHKPQSWDSVQTSSLKKIKGVCFDIDDTFSSKGKITPHAYHALWQLKNAGYALVPVTGRPAGWCDHIARFWPVDAVICENGAFAFYMQDGVRKRLDTPGSDPQAKVKLQNLAAKIKSRFPHAVWASDQPYRENDLAIDICEDVPAWNHADVDDLLKLCHDEGAHAKLSSIHVNTWYGDFDKKKGFKAWLDEGAPGCASTRAKEGISAACVPAIEDWIYLGDSPNDEPLFEFFPHSVGVANLKQYLSRLKHPPTWITASESGDGFVEVARRLTST